MIHGMKPLYWFLAAIILFAAGVGLFFVRHLGDPPSYTCVEEGNPTSGFAIEVDGKQCPLSVEDFQAYWDYDHSAVPVHRVGFGLCVVSIGLTVTGTVSAIRRRRRRRAALPAAA